MIPAQTLSQLANIHELLTQLVEQSRGPDCNRPPAPELPSLGWLLGRAVYLETYLLRERLFEDDDLTRRVRHLFGRDVPYSNALDAALPPRDHLLNWALEIFDHHLTLLANPGQLPEHPWLRNGWLAAWLVQSHALAYERMLSSLSALAQQRDDGTFLVAEPLQSRLPAADAVRIDQGHYRIGAREGVVMDNEEPVQVVELHSFRIQKQPVSNAEYLAFIEDGGYRDDGWWTPAGQAWLRQSGAQAPWHWRRDAQGAWYAIGMNGAMQLVPEAAVSGLSQHEANAFAAWAAARGEGLSGAVVQHEFQWETAARLGMIEGTGRVWEWCANTFEAYDGYEAPVEAEFRTPAFDSGQAALKGACLHTQPALRRASFRRGADPAARHLFSGTRLVLPPGKAAWE